MVSEAAGAIIHRRAWLCGTAGSECLATVARENEGEKCGQTATQLLLTVRDALALLRRN